MVKTKNLDPNTIIVYTEQYATYPKITGQIIGYLSERGYHGTEGFAIDGPVIKEIKIDTLFVNRLAAINGQKGRKRIAIKVGRFDR